VAPEVYKKTVKNVVEVHEGWKYTVS